MVEESWKWEAPPGLTVCTLYLCVALVVLSALTYFIVEVFVLSWLHFFQLVADETAAPDGMPKLAVRPGGAADGGPKPRRGGGGGGSGGKKAKEDELDPAAARIARYTFPPTHLFNMPYFEQFSDSVRCLGTGVAVLALCDVLLRFSTPSWHPQVFGGGIAAFTVGAILLQRLLANCVKVQFAVKTTQSGDWMLCSAVGLVSAITAFCVLHLLPSTFSAFDFKFASNHTAQALAANVNRYRTPDTPPWEPVPIDVTLIHVTLAVISGALSFILLPCAMRLVRCYLIGTDTSLWVGNDLLSRPWRIRFVLHLSLTLPIVSFFLWVTPLAEIFLLDPTEGRGGEGGGWAEDWRISPSSFHSLRLFLILFWGAIQTSCVRINVQSYLNSGAIAWYDLLHGSLKGPPSAEAIKQRLAIPIRYMLKTALQCIAPGAIPVLLLGLARTRGAAMDGPAISEGYFMPTSLIREVCVFLSWWCSASWAVQTCVILIMFKMGSFTGGVTMSIFTDRQ